jgi:hypothetical protein
MQGAAAAIEVLDRALQRLMDHRHVSRSLQHVIRSACVQRANFRILAMLDPKPADIRSDGSWHPSSALHPRVLQYDAALIHYFSRRTCPDYFFVLGVSCYFRNIHAEATALLAQALHAAPQRRWVFASGMSLAQRMLTLARGQEHALQGRWQLLEWANGA